MAGPWLSLVGSTRLSSGPAPPHRPVCEARASPRMFTAGLLVPRSAPEPRMLACSQPQTPRLPAPPVPVTVEKPQTNQKLGVCPVDILRDILEQAGPRRAGAGSGRLGGTPAGWATSGCVPPGAARRAGPTPLRRRQRFSWWLRLQGPSFCSGEVIRSLSHLWALHCPLWLLGLLHCS